MADRMKRKGSLLIAAILTAHLLSGCTPKDVEAAKQIESFIQQNEQRASSFENIDLEKLDVQNSVNIITELASSKYKGRKTGTPENEAAVQYVADYFRSIGLQSPDGLDNYLQPYHQSVTKLKDTPKLELLTKDNIMAKSFEYPKNFVFNILSDKTQDIELEGPIRVVSSLAELQNSKPEENEILLFSAQAKGRNTMTQLMREVYPTKAAAIVVEMDVNSENRHYSDLIVTTLSNRQWGDFYKPVVTVDSQTFAELSSASQEHKKLKLQCSYELQNSYKAYNVVGYIPGSDPVLRDKYIIIGAHLDHVGDNFNGTYNPGTLDNASGVASVMELARVIMQNPVKPKRSIVFIAFNGEESGLNGSAAYTEEPAFPLRNSVMINLDMVGASYELPLSIANSEAFVADLKLEFLELAKRLNIEAESSRLSASDHYYFGEKGVPAVALSHFDDMHGYHSPNDTMEDVDVEQLREAMKLVLFYIDKKAF